MAHGNSAGGPQDGLDQQGVMELTSESDRLADRLQRDGEKTLEFFRGLAPGQWDQQVYTTGSGWNVQQILAHFVSAERAFNQLIVDVASGGQGAPRDLKIDDFNEAEVPRLGSQSREQLLQAFSDARGRSVELARGLAASDLERRGYHPWFGDMELRPMLKLVYRHNLIHLRDVRRALESGSPVPHTEVTPPSEKPDHP